MVRITALAFALGLFCSPLASAGSVYWYVDDNGVTHFGSEPEDGGVSSGQMEYQEIPDDSIVTNPNGTTTTVINPSQFSEGTYSGPASSSGPASGATVIRRSSDERQPDADPSVRPSIVKDKKEVINLSNRPMYEDDFD
ncbi:MAG: DUF4124 domain-containing protein [Succinivibrionaceae bacterium]|nr:DUF4124 domain-containing protein [Succinivibrionaceae bacterium]